MVDDLPDLSGLETAVEDICTVVDRLRGRIDQLHVVCEELVSACRLFTDAAHDVRDTCNDRGLSSPASIAYAAEVARNAIAIAESNGVPTPCRAMSTRP